MAEQMMPPPEGGAEPMSAPQAMPGEAEQVSPEEQEMYTTFVSMGYQLIYSDQMFPKMLEMLDGGGDPIRGLSQTAVAVVERVLGAAQSSGQQISPAVIQHGGTEIFADLAQLATKAKVHDFTTDQDGLEAAYFQAVDQMRVSLQQSGMIDQAAAQEEFGRLQQMDQDGGLESLFGRFAEEDDAAGQEAPEGDPEADPRQGLAMGMQ